MPPVVADVLRVLDAAAASRNPENAVVFRLVAATGCRRGELCGLKWSAVDIDGDVPRVMARLHDLRHLQASLLLGAGEAITTVSAPLGHRDTSTTLTIYSHLMPGADQRAAGIVGKAFARPPAEDSPDGSQLFRYVVPRGVGAHVVA